MSLGYAEKLSYRNDVGDVGMSEVFDPPHVLEQKIAELAAIIKESKHLVAFTGAGISTSCGIPDFRGPKGVWTLRREGKEVPEASVLFHRAIPSMTHMALVELEKAGILKFVISQNVDCLHLRSGIPREKLAELHGNSFKEICPSCGLEYLRDFEIESIGMKSTSRNCSDVECGARLRDTIIDWENELPASEMKPAKKHCRKADAILCLGTSLQIAPACNLPIKALNRGGNMVIVNLQETPHDAKASLVIHGLVDKVIAGVMQYINLRIPPYVRVDLFQISLTHCSKPLSTEKKYVKWALRVESVHGPKALLPFIVSVEVSFPGRPNLKPAVLHKQPFRLKSLTIKFRTLASKKNVPGQIRGTSISSLRLARTHGLVQVRPKVMANLFPEVELTVIEVTSNDTPPVPKPTPLTLNFGDGCGCQSASIEFPVDLQAEADNISHNKKSVIENLIRSQRCGQISIIERKNLVSPEQEITVFAVVTNVIQYGSLPANSSYTLSKNGKLVRRQNDDVRCSGVSLKKKKCY